jgi:hypothetical protein
MMHRLLIGSLFVAALAVPSPAYAQLDEPSWGVIVGFAPIWRVPDGFKALFGATQLEIEGLEFRGGVIRGTTFGGEWGVVLVHKRISEKSVIAVRQANDVIQVVAEDAELLGVELHQFLPFARIGRAQIGAVVGGGVAQMRGFLVGTLRQGNTPPVTTHLFLPELFELSGRDLKLFPIGRAEIAVNALLGDRVKLRVGSGFNMPGIQLFSISTSVLLGRD